MELSYKIEVLTSKTTFVIGVGLEVQLLDEFKTELGFN
jgi:hypothetical protein